MRKVKLGVTIFYCSQHAHIHWLILPPSASATTHALPTQCPLYFLPSPSGRRSSTGMSWVSGRDQAHYVLGMDGRREWPLFLHPLAQKLWEAALANTFDR